MDCAFVLLMLWTGGGPPWILGHCSRGDQSCDILFRRFVSLWGGRHRTWQRELIWQGLLLLVIRRHTHFNANTHYWSYTHALVLNLWCMGCKFWREKISIWWSSYSSALRMGQGRGGTAQWFLPLESTALLLLWWSHLSWAHVCALDVQRCRCMYSVCILVT